MVVHYDKPPPTGGDYGVIFVADNMNVTQVVLSGDYNQNGIVDAADYVVWRQGLGATYTQNNYDVWRSNFGRPIGVGAVANDAVPEPAISVLLILATASFCPGRRSSTR